jgi:hypothetical protein
MQCAGQAVIMRCPHTVDALVFFVRCPSWGQVPLPKHRKGYLAASAWGEGSPLVLLHQRTRGWRGVRGPAASAWHGHGPGAGPRRAAQIESCPPAVLGELLTLPPDVRPQVLSEPPHIGSQVQSPLSLGQLDQGLSCQPPSVATRRPDTGCPHAGLCFHRRAPKHVAVSESAVLALRVDDPLKCTGGETSNAACPAL